MKFYNMPQEAAGLVERAMFQTARLEFKVRNAKSASVPSTASASSDESPERMPIAKFLEIWARV